MNDASTKHNEIPITGGSSERIGLIGWLILYASAILLFFLLFIHVLAIHFFGDGQIIAMSVRDHASSWLLRIVSLGLLLIGLIHGLIGFFRIILDLEILRTRESSWLKWLLSLTGAGLLVYGIFVFSGLAAL